MANSRFESSVTAVSWIPSEAITGPSKIPFELGVTHYDEPPPDVLQDLEELRTYGPLPRSERAAGVHRGRGRPDRQRRPPRPGPHRRHDGPRRPGGRPVPGRPPAGHPAGARDHGRISARFVQTVGGRMGLPTPRPVPHKPFFQFWPSIAWTTLALTLNADGTSSHELVGASPFPRHWIYDAEGRLVEKSAVIDFSKWFNHAFGDRTPWGELDSPAVVAAVESALERSLSSGSCAAARSRRSDTRRRGRDAPQPGRRRHRRLPDPRRDLRRRGRWRAGRRGRTRGGRRRARRPRRRQADRDPAGARRRPGSPACPPTRSTRRPWAASRSSIGERSSPLADNGSMDEEPDAGTLTADELAALVGDGPERIAQLTATGVITPDADGRYAPGDAHRVRVVDGFEAAGLALDVLIRAQDAGLISIAYYDELHPPPGRPSDVRPTPPARSESRGSPAQLHLPRCGCSSSRQSSEQRSPVPPTRSSAGLPAPMSASRRIPSWRARPAEKPLNSSG